MATNALDANQQAYINAVFNELVAIIDRSYPFSISFNLGDFFVANGAGASKSTIHPGAVLFKTNSQSGTSYTATSTDSVIFMTNDAVRTLTIPGAAATGTVLFVADSSGSVTAAHTLTVAAATGNINGAANTVITPGTNKTATLVSDGTNWWVLAKI